MIKVNLNKSKLFALVDDADFELVSKFPWHAQKCKHTTYASCRTTRNGKRISMRMHQLVAGSKRGQQVDHKDGNGLNNQRVNLRICNNQKNHWNLRLSTKNTSGFKGVYFNKTAGKWQVAIGGRGNRIVIGRFDEIIPAAIAYNNAAKRLYGEFAFLNKIPQQKNLNPAKE